MPQLHRGIGESQKGKIVMYVQLSPLQFAVLSAAKDGRISEATLGAVQQGTLGSLLMRGLVTRSAGHRLVLTDEGRELYNRYTRGGIPTRKVAGPVTDRVAQLLRFQMRRHLSMVRKETA